jgi:glutamine amidotransferase
MKIAIIDYGVGNLGSLCRALKKVNASPQVVTSPRELKSSDVLILPGVGNFGDCSRILQRNGWFSAIKEEVLGGGKPILGICLGMQLLADSSAEGTDEEGNCERGLGLISGRVVSLRSLGCSLRTPHVGWNNVDFIDGNKAIFRDVPNNSDFYFVHSFVFITEEPRHTIAKVDYGVRFAAVVNRDNVWGTQFHPEKSSSIGARLIQNFVKSLQC